MTFSLHEKAKLRQRIEGWFGRDLTESELNQFDVESLVGMNGMINVVVNDVKGKQYSNVASVSPLPKKMQPLIAENNELPKWVEEKWLDSEEMKFIQNNQTNNSSTTKWDKNDAELQKALDIFPDATPAKIK